MRSSVSRFPLVFLLTICLATTFVQAQNEDDAAARAKVLALEKAWNQAYKIGDSKALGAILDDNLILVNDDGSMQTKAEFLKGVKAATSNAEQVVPETLTVHVFGKTAVAVGVITVKGKSGVRRERFIDTWLERNGNWVCIATDATPIRRSGG